MNDYADIILLIAAIALFGVVTLNISRSMALNNRVLTHSEVSYGAVSAAQDVIDHARWIKYGDITSGKLEDYFSSKYSGSLYNADVYIPDNFTCPTSNPCKQFNVEITSTFMRDTVTMSILKTKFINHNE